MSLSLHVSLAAHLQSDQFHVKLLLARRGDSPFLGLLLSPVNAWSGPVHRWLNGGPDWSNGYQWIEPVWTERDVNPWDICSFWVQVSSDGHGLVRQTIRDLADRPQDGVEAIVRLVEQHGRLSELPAKSRADLQQLLRAHLQGLRVIRVVNGDEEASTPKLTLAAAQAYAERVLAGGKVDRGDLEFAKRILTDAPLRFGFWSAFKATLKYADPGQCPAEFGAAVVRLSISNSISQVRNGHNAENVSVLEDFGQVPSRATVEYMSRRMRRWIKRTGSRDPSTYLSVAASILTNWSADELTSEAHSPAFIMFGRQQHMRSGSYRVARSVQLDVRSDAFPELWDANLETVKTISDESKSVIVLAWAQNILSEHGRQITVRPEMLSALLTVDHRALQRAACSALASTSDRRVFDAITQFAWTSFFREATAEEFSTVCARVREAQVPMSCMYAVDQELHSERDTDRLLAFSEIWFSQSQFRPYDDEADVIALHRLAAAHDLQPGSAWFDVLKSVRPNSLIAVYGRMCEQEAEVGLVSRAAVAEAIFNDVQRSTSQFYSPAEGVARQLFRVGSAEAVALAWRILGLAKLSESCAQWLLRCVDSGAISDAAFVEGVSALLRLASTEELASALPIILASPHISAGSGLIGLLGKLESPGPAVWSAFSSTAAGEVLEEILGSKPLLERVEPSLTAPSIRTATPNQLRLVRAILEAVPDRLKNDLEFGIACATALDGDLQAEALMQMQRNGLVDRIWLRLAESGMPRAVRTARSYLEKIKDSQDFRAAMLACIDSQVDSTRDLGLQLLDERREHIDVDIWRALSESDDPVVQSRVVEEATAGASISEEQLANLDRRILVTRRGPRSTKENVKQRLAMAMEETPQLQPDRLDALLDLARGSNARDREWAMQRLVLLKLHGVAVDDVEIGAFSGGDSQ